MIFLCASTLLVLGLGGGGSWLASIFGSRKNDAIHLANDPNFQILIPAHNEEKKIAITLQSLESELHSFSNPVKILIALDSCTDQTQAVIQSFSDRLKIEIVSVSYRSKWLTLQHLVSSSDAAAEWLIFLDSGISFEKNLLKIWVNALKDRSRLLVAPAYRIEGASIVHRLFWKFEKTLKQLENKAGGPISVHGAAVAYQKSVIQTVFRHLNLDHSSDFKNDDVILPLASRVLFKKMNAFYLADHCVFDLAHADQVSFETNVNQKKRMMIGNLQWIRWMQTDSRISKPLSIRLIALRRVLRPFWIYVLLIFTAALVFEFGCVGLVMLAPILLFRAAALASLQAPIAWMKKSDQKLSAWK